LIETLNQFEGFIPQLMANEIPCGSRDDPAQLSWAIAFQLAQQKRSE